MCVRERRLIGTRLFADWLVAGFLTLAPASADTNGHATQHATLHRIGLPESGEVPSWKGAPKWLLIQQGKQIYLNNTAIPTRTSDNGKRLAPIATPLINSDNLRVTNSPSLASTKDRATNNVSIIIILSVCAKLKIKQTPV